MSALIPEPVAKDPVALIYEDLINASVFLDSLAMVLMAVKISMSVRCRTPADQTRFVLIKLEVIRAPAQKDSKEMLIPQDALVGSHDKKQIK
jgi:hypothetical protein